MPYPIPRWTILGLLLLPAYESGAHLGSHYACGLREALE
jgi:hypothetical protein